MNSQLAADRLTRNWQHRPVPENVILTLDNTERDRFTAELVELFGRVGDRPLEAGVLAETEIAALGLPRWLLARLIDFRINGNDVGTLLIRNLPVDTRLPPTPTPQGDSPAWPGLWRGVLAHLCVTSILGDVIGYADEKSGDVVQDVFPIAGSEEFQENAGSVVLELHTEDGFHPHKPDFLTLYGVRADHELAAHTVTGSIRMVLAELPADVVHTLRQPIYRIGFSRSFVGAGPPRWSAAIPVLSGPASSPDLCVDFFAMESLTGDGALALERLRRAINAALVGVVLRPGELLVVDNRVAVHGRTAFVPRFDGADRWLRRCLAVADLRRSRGTREPGSRVCAPIT